MKIITFSNDLFFLFFYLILVTISCDKINTGNQKQNTVSSVENTKIKTHQKDNSNELKIELKNFDLIIKSDEEPYSVEYKKLVGHNDYDGNIYEKRDTILINKYGDLDFVSDPSFLDNKQVQFVNKSNLKKVEVVITFNYGVDGSFIDNRKYYTFKQIVKLNENNTFFINDDIRGKNFTAWFQENNLEIIKSSYENAMRLVEDQKKCCPNDLEDFEIFTAKAYNELTYEDLNILILLESILLEVKGESPEGKIVTGFIKG